MLISLSIVFKPVRFIKINRDELGRHSDGQMDSADADALNTITPRSPIFFIEIIFVNFPQRTLIIGEVSLYV